MTVKEINKCNNFIITIGKFLSHYYYINSSNANKLSHEAFMEIFEVDSIPNEDIDLDDVICGDIILVSDTYDRVFGYINPLIIKQEEQPNFFISGLDLDDYAANSDCIDLGNLKLEELTDYELDQLLTESKRIKDERAKHKIIKELKFRPESKPGTKQVILERVRKRELKKEEKKER